MLKRVLIFLLLVVKFGHTQEKNNTSRDSVKINKLLKEVVVTGQFFNTSKEDALHDINVIDSKIINTGLFENLSDILQYQNNIRISNDNILGSDISLQGLSGENIKILINGVPVIGRLNGSIDVSQINLNNIERIEIVEGPLSVNFGSDALAGTINIIKNTASKNNTDQLFESYYESVGRYNNSILLTHHYKNQSVSNQFSRNYFKGWSENDKFSLLPTAQIADSNRFKTWNPKEQISNRIEHALDLQNKTINSYHEYFYEKITNKGKPQESTLYATAFDDYYYTFRNNIGSQLKISLNDYNITSILAYNQYKRIKNTMFKDLTTLSSILLDDPSAQDTSFFKLLMWKNSISNQNKSYLNYQIGLDIQRQLARGERIINKEQYQNDYAIFSNIEWELNESLIFRLGIRMIYNTKYSAPVIPAINLLYKQNNIRIRGSYAKGFRAPSLKELFFEFIDINHNIVGNPNLLAERSDNYRISISKSNKWREIFFSSSISAFYNDIDNKIALSNINQEYSYFNIDRYKTQGILFKHKISNDNFIFDNGLSYTGRYNNLSEVEDLRVFNYSLEYSSNIILFISARTKFNIFYKYNGPSSVFITSESNEIIETSTESYHLLDMAINKDLLLNQLTLSIGFKNLLDVTDVKNSRQNSIHSSNSNNLNIGYGRIFFLNIKIKI